MPTRIAASSGPAPDQRLGGVVEAPVLPRDEGRAGIEEILAVLQVEDRIARRRCRGSRAADRWRRVAWREGRASGSRAGARSGRKAAPRARRRRGRRRRTDIGSVSRKSIDCGATILPRHAGHRTRSAPRPTSGSPIRAAAHTLAAYAGRPVVLYFYPKDDTSGCQGSLHLPGRAARSTREAAVLGLSVLGTRQQGEVRQEVQDCRFRCSPTRITPWPIATAPGSRRACTVASHMGVARISYLIGPDGRVVHRWDTVKPADHAAEVARRGHDAEALVPWNRDF